MADETKITDPAAQEAAELERKKQEDAAKKKAAAEKAAEAKRKKAEGAAQKKADAGKAAAAKPTGNKALAREYAKRYPKETEFHITTDKQVFLGRDLSLARAHQRSLGSDGQVETIKID